MMQCIDQMDLSGKKVIVRVDFNVPLKDGVITDDNRMRQALPTLQYALEKGAALIVCSHLGKPKGQMKPELSLRPVADHLSKLLGKPVAMAADCVGPAVEAAAADLKSGEVLVLENLRFHPEEEKGDDAFGAQLAALADVYVNDAFGTAHRPHASMVAIAEHSKTCCAGFLMKKEWEYLAEALKAPERPYVAVSGGAKVSTKVAVLDNLLESVDHVIIGGAMANTFFLAQGHGVGKSLVEEDAVATAKEIMAKAEAKGVKLHLPVDCVLGDDFKEGKALKTVPVDQVDPELMILDIGPESVKNFREVVMGAKTVVWNGPMGAFENPAFAEGSKGVAQALAESPALTIMGGGDTGPILKLTGLTDKIDFLSTGGGSFLEFMEGKELPAFTALQKCGS